MFKIRPEVGWREMDEDQTVVVDTSTTYAYLLTHVSSLIWKNIEGSSMEGILDKILDEYDITLSIAKNDLENFIDDLFKKKLIE